MSARLSVVLSAALIAAPPAVADYQGIPACPRGTVHEAIVDQAYTSCMSKQRSAARCAPDRSTQRCVSQLGAAEHLRCPRGTFLRDDRCWPIR
jgi:hypothetical protein